MKGKSAEKSREKTSERGKASRNRAEYRNLFIHTTEKHIYPFKEIEGIKKIRR
ncbi:MAG: hypothetical protein OCU12_04480 [Methanophagales archaeon]|nr:hypothetical protein [Methanophagales archaeon]